MRPVRHVVWCDQAHHGHWLITLTCGHVMVTVQPHYDVCPCLECPVYASTHQGSLDSWMPLRTIPAGTEPS